MRSVYKNTSMNTHTHTHPKSKNSTKLKFLRNFTEEFIAEIVI